MSTTETRGHAAAEKDPAAALDAKRVTMPGFTTQVGPLGHLHQERARLDQLTWTNFAVRRVAATLGAELSGIDITADLGDDVIEEIGAALAAYKVIFFRDQPLTPERHVAFARRFGELELHPFIPGNDRYPELVRFAKGAEVGGYENGWHHDVTWRECPSMGAILHAIDVPECGGDTLFCDMSAVYEGLDDSTKEQVDGLTAVHDFFSTFGHQVSAEDRDAARQKYPLVEHPVVSTHPVTGKKLLYINRFFTSHIVGLGEAESLALIDRLCAETDLVEYQCRFQWRPDSVAFWDNRAVQHYAASDYWPDIRTMERASIVGTRPA